MKIGVLGTGMVGQTLATGLVAAGHDVVMGSRTAGNEAAATWATGSGGGRAGTFADAAAHGELVVNATAGAASVEALQAAGAGNLGGKVLVDVANPIDGASGFPPILSVANSDSLAEEIQRTFPDARVVKTLNTISAPVMVNPSLVPGHHNVFLSGNDADAKETVRGLLVGFGWPSEDVLDLGDITTARATEMYLVLWLRLFMAKGSPMINIQVQAAGAG